LKVELEKGEESSIEKSQDNKAESDRKGTPELKPESEKQQTPE